MKLSGMQLKYSQLCLFIGVAIISFSLFLHPKDPKEFLQLAIFDPQETFNFLYGFVQTIAFWTGTGLLIAGITGLLHALIKYLRCALPVLRRRKDHPIVIDSEDNWIFL